MEPGKSIIFFTRLARRIGYALAIQKIRFGDSRKRFARLVIGRGRTAKLTTKLAFTNAPKQNGQNLSEILEPRLLKPMPLVESLTQPSLREGMASIRRPC